VAAPPEVEPAALPGLLAPGIPLLVDEPSWQGTDAFLTALAAWGLREGRPVLVLVPDLLTLARVRPILRRTGEDPTLLHGDLAPADRVAVWDGLRRRTPPLLLGTRSALGAPLADLGLVVVVDEHDPSYKSDRTPRLQGRDVALALAGLAGAPSVLLSGAPAVDSVGWGAAGRYRHVRLAGRQAAQPLEVVDLRGELAAGVRGLLSRPLLNALAELAGRRQGRALLLMNRRGTASVVLCRDCGHVLVCRECGRALVYHATGRTLRCHHCDLAAPPVDRCPACASPRIRYLGGGTERVESEVRARFPSLRVGRLDRDVTASGLAQRDLVAAFLAGELDVLVGTSLALRRLDEGTLDLLAVVSADVGLALPEERAAERTYQLLHLAARRLAPDGRGILQTYRPDHPAVVAVATGDPIPFYQLELEARRRFRSPPFGRLVKLVLAGPDDARVRREAEELARELRGRSSRVEVLGPQPPFVPRRAGQWRQQIVLRGDDPVDLLRGIELGVGWAVDVDPETLL
jgi:primosomal protein N' (replication factor Y)